MSVTIMSSRVSGVNSSESYHTITTFAFSLLHRSGVYQWRIFYTTRTSSALHPSCSGSGCYFCYPSHIRTKLFHNELELSTLTAVGSKFSQEHDHREFAPSTDLQIRHHSCFSPMGPAGNPCAHARPFNLRMLASHLEALRPLLS